MSVVDRDAGVGAEEATLTTENQTGTKPARRILTRTAAAGQKKQEASLAKILHVSV